MKHFSSYVATMDTKDLYLRIGFCPEMVRITKLSDGQDNLWCRMLGNDGALVRVVAGDRTVSTTAGIKLVQFTDDAIDLSAAPDVIDPGNWIDANGIMITGDVAFLADDNIVLVEAWTMDSVFIKAVHDGTTSVNYLEDSTFDFEDLGVSGNLTWICYNQTNGNYGYIKSVLQPQGKSNKCRLILSDASGTEYTAAQAAIATDDVCYILPRKAAWYPMSDIGIIA